MKILVAGMGNVLRGDAGFGIRVIEELSKNHQFPQGKLTFNPWLDREGKPRVSADIILQDFEFVGGNAAKTAQEVAEETIPAQENNQMAASENITAEDAEERAEMLAAIRDMDAGDEAFAGQY